MNQQLQNTKLVQRRHSVGLTQPSLQEDARKKTARPPPLNLSDLAGGGHSRQKSLGGLRASLHNKSYSRLAASHVSNNNLTMREDDLTESRSSTSTFETQRRQKYSMKRFLLSNKFGTGSVSVPKGSKEANFFSIIQPLITGSIFQVQILSKKYAQRRVCLDVLLNKLYVGTESLLIESLDKTEINLKTLELIKIIKMQINKKQEIKQTPEFSFSLVLSADKTS